MATKLGITDFGGSNRWLDIFKSRHDLSFRFICGESETVNEETAVTWMEEVLPNLLKDYSPDDIYNADEFGLFFVRAPVLVTFLFH